MIEIETYVWYALALKGPSRHCCAALSGADRSPRRILFTQDASDISGERLILRPLFLALGLIVAYGGLAAAQETPEPIDLSTLVRESEVFVTADGGAPYSGPVFSAFETDTSKIREQGTLKNGEWEGLYESFYFNGQPKSRIQYRDAEYHGLFERYYFSGDLIAKGMYEMGARCGEWFDDGGEWGGLSGLSRGVTGW